MTNPSNISKWLKEIYNFLANFQYFFPQLLFLTLGIVMFWHSNQGIDVLYGVSDTFGHTIGLFIATWAWAILTWYSARLREQKARREEDTLAKSTTDLLYMLPRILGIAVFLIIAISWSRLAFLLILKKAEIPLYINILSYGILLLLLGVIYWLYTRKQTWKPIQYIERHKVLATSLWFLISSLIIYPTVGKTNFNPTALLLVIFVSLSYAFLFGRLIVNREKINPAEDKDNSKPKSFWAIMAGDLKEEKVTLMSKMLFGLIVIASFVLLMLSFIHVVFANLFGAAMIVLISFSFFTVLIVRFQVMQSFNQFKWLVGISLMGLFNFYVLPNTYKLRFLEDKNKSISKRENLSTYFENWLATNHPTFQDSTNQDTLPIFMVVTHGGALRAGYWTAAVLANLEERTKGTFHKHLFALSGASGGSLGTATYMALLQKQLQQPSQNGHFIASTDSILGNDFLSFSLARMIMGDYTIFRLFKLPSFLDRAGALEVAFEAGIKPTFPQKNNPFSTDFLALWGNQATPNHEMPILFINSCRLDDGLPAVVSNVDISKDPYFRNRKDILSEISQKETNKTISLSTAISVGARFPYISPAGAIGNSDSADYYVDGGYFDNSGAGSIADLVQSLQYQYSQETWFHRIQFHIIHITTSDSDNTATKFGKMSSINNDFLAPLLTFSSNTGGQATVSVRDLRTVINGNPNQDNRNYHLFKPARKDSLNQNLSTNEFPLNWYLSKKVLTEMGETCIQCSKEEFNKVSATLEKMK